METNEIEVHALEELERNLCVEHSEKGSEGAGEVTELSSANGFVAPSASGFMVPSANGFMMPSANGFMMP